MFIDLTVSVAPAMMELARDNEKKAFAGHLGTHFDVMNKEFPLEYVERQAVVFDVAAVAGRDVEPTDIDCTLVKKGMFVAFRTGFIEDEGYGTERYFRDHPQLSPDLIDRLLQAEVSIIAIDCAGIRRGREHTPTDQRCADRGVFVVENLCNLPALLRGGKATTFIAHTYPIKFEGMTGLPCRVVAEV